MRALILGLVLCTSGAQWSASFAEDGEPERPIQRQASTIAVPKLVKEMQLLARRNPVGRTKLEQEVTLEQLREQIREEFEGLAVEYETRVKSVDWRSDMLILQFVSPMPRYTPSRRMPFRITMSASVKIPMTREEAQAIRKGSRASFHGKLKFLPGLSSIGTRAPKVQPVLSVKHLGYGAGALPIGSFVADAYQVNVGGDVVFSSSASESE